jgi:hypothetical protein
MSVPGVVVKLNYRWTYVRCYWRLTDAGMARFVLIPGQWSAAKGAELEARP